MNMVFSLSFSHTRTHIFCPSLSFTPCDSFIHTFYFSSSKNYEKTIDNLDYFKTTTDAFLVMNQHCFYAINFALLIWRVSRQKY